MKQYDPQIKKTIRDLIDAGTTDEAESLINRYGPALREDPEVYCMRADLAEKSGKTDEAEEILKEGLDAEGKDPGLLSRLGSLYQKKGLKEASLYFYSRSLSGLKTQEQKDEIQKKITEIKESGEEDGEVPVSIVVVDCGNPGFMVNCLDNLYKYTVDTKFELITIYCGSGGGIKEFLDSLPNKKKLDIRGNYGRIMMESVKEAAGKYIAILPGSAIVTHNWLSNLIKCIDSDENIGMAAPMSNIGYGEVQPGPSFGTIAENQAYARDHNISNPDEWEGRLSLISRGTISRAEALKCCFSQENSRDIYSTGNFIDSDISFGMRRLGYKLIYAKDTFVYFQAPLDAPADYGSGKLERDRRVFSWKFGVDPWEDTAPSQDIINSIEYNRDGEVRILGINPRCGSTLLQVKNNFMCHGIYDIKLYALTEDKKYMDDLKSVCDYAVNSHIGSMASLYDKDSFDIIFIESPLGQNNGSYMMLKDLKELMKPDGQLILSLGNTSYYLNIYNLVNNVESGDRVPYLSKRGLVNDIKCAGFDDINVSALKLNIPEEYRRFLKVLSDMSSRSEAGEREDIFSIKRYIFSMKGKSELKNVLIYPGFDTLLDDRIFLNGGEDSLKKPDRGRVDGEILKGVFREKGYNLMTIDRRHFEEAEFIIFEDAPKSPDNRFYKDYYHLLYRGNEFLKECMDLNLKDRMVLVIHEPPGVMPENYDRSIHDCFKIIFTWDDDMVDNKKYFKYNRPQPSGINRNFARSFKNRKLCTALMSNNYIKEDGELHSERVRAAKFFEDNHQDKFDFYGRGWDRKQFRCYKGAADNKMEILGKYKFCLAYENNCKYKGNITEKLFDCFLAGCVPIYLGAPNISEYIPQNTFIDMRRFSTYEELYEFINNMPEAKYNKYIESINNFLRSHRYYKFTDIYYAENIANVLKGSVMPKV